MAFWLALWFSVLLSCLSLKSVLAFEEDEDGESVGKKRQVNFASVSAGAVVLESSPKANGYRHLLNDDKDKYGISPCGEKKWLVVGLSEDVQYWLRFSPTSLLNSFLQIVVEEIVVANYEKFSSSLETFQILSSTSFPATDWIDLGTFLAAPDLGEQIFQIDKPSWGRYLKFRFLTHHGDEFYCTLTQIKYCNCCCPSASLIYFPHLTIRRVHGSTVLENLKKEVERSSREVLDLENVILEEDQDSPTAAGDLQDQETSEADDEASSPAPPGNDVHHPGTTTDPLSSSTSAPVFEDGSLGSQAVDPFQPPVNADGSQPDATLPSSPLEFSPSLDIDSNHSPLGTLSENLTFGDLAEVEAVILQSDLTSIHSSLPDPATNLSESDSNSAENSSSVNTSVLSPYSNYPHHLSPTPAAADLSSSSPKKSADSDLSNLSAEEILEVPMNEEQKDLEEDSLPEVVEDTSVISDEGMTNASLDSLVDREESSDTMTATIISADIKLEVLNSSDHHISPSASPLEEQQSSPPPLPSNISSSSPAAAPAAESHTDTPPHDPSVLPPNDAPLSALPISKLKTCIDQLKFPEFQAKMRAKLAAGTHLLNQSSSPSAAELNQDVFRSLMKKISSLEQNSKIIELYLLQVSHSLSTHPSYQCLTFLSISSSLR
jgi:hypothetical protein